ncbi:DUF4003 family protein [Peptococcaceae bacterium 1198_IL3148]
MLDNQIKSQLDELVQLYILMNKKYRWRANDLTVRFGSFLFCLKDKPFDETNFEEVIMYIKNNTGVFSTHRSKSFALAPLLITSFDDAKHAFDHLLDYEKLMRDTGFKKSPYLTIAAYALMLTCPPKQVPQRIAKAYDIYKRMKGNHYWLTSADDYPVAILLADMKDDLGQIESEMERCYHQLNEVGFKKSNGLQFLSHLLTFNPAPAESKAILCQEIVDYLKQRKLGISATYYGAIGFLALLGNDAKKALPEVVTAVNYLKKQQGFKWFNKELNILITASLVCNKYLEDKKHRQMMATTMGISIETMVAAQTAALIAATSAAAATAAASSN